MSLALPVRPFFTRYCMFIQPTIGLYIIMKTKLEEKITVEESRKANHV